MCLLLPMTTSSYVASAPEGTASDFYHGNCLVILADFSLCVAGIRNEAPIRLGPRVT